MPKTLLPIHKVMSITLCMPLFIQVFELLGIRIHLNVVLLFLLTPFLLIALLFNYSDIRISKISIPFFIFLILSLVQIVSLSRLLPVMFFLQCFLLTLFVSHSDFNDIILANRKVIYFVTVVYVSVSLLLLMLGLNFSPIDGRFYGLGYSPTTFVLFLIVLLVLFHYVYKSSFTFCLLYAIAIALTFFSGTRTGLLLLLLLPINNIIYDKYLRSKKMLRILIFFFVMAVYPLAEYISINNPELMEYRMTNEDETDYSYATRIVFTAEVADKWLEGNWGQKIMGFGTEYSRMTIFDLYDEDVQLHNDFLRFIVDFGLPATIFFLGIIYSFSCNNKYSFFLALIYLFSFYHNMIYELFLFNVLLFMNKAK